MGKFGNITVAMATFPPRLMSALQVLKSLWPQCNHLRICLNDFPSVPQEILDFAQEIQSETSSDHTFEYILAGDNHAIPDLGCNNKMRWIDSCDGYYLTVDDDIVYPDNYVQALVDGIDRYDGCAVCTMHGKILHDGKKFVLYLGTRIFYDTKITIPGMGVGGCVPKKIGLTWDVFNKEKNSGDDELISIWCMENNIPCMCLQHDRHWLKEIKPDGYSLFQDVNSRNSRLNLVQQYMNGSVPVISIVIPCHNCEKTISTLLEKLLLQRFRQWECICVDDSVTKAGRATISKYSKKDSRIRLITNTKNPGAGENRNIGLKNSHGKYIWFVDCDDEFAFNDDGLSYMIAAMEKYAADFHVFPCMLRQDGELVKSWLDISPSVSKLYDKIIIHAEDISSSEMKLGELWQAVKIVPWNKVYEKQFLNKYKSELQYQNTHFANDNRFMIEVIRHFNTVAFHKTQPIYIYNKSSKGISGLSNKWKYLQDVGKLFDWIMEIPGDNVRDSWLFKGRMRVMASLLVDIQNYVLQTKQISGDMFLSRISSIVGKQLSSPKLLPYAEKFPIYRFILNQYQHRESNPRPRATHLASYPQASTCDVVYVYHTSSRPEIHSEIRSIRKFCPFVNRIFIVGNPIPIELNDPKCEFIECQDFYKSNKAANDTIKILKVIKRIPDLSDNFVVWHDNCIVTKPCTWDDFKPKYTKKFNKDDPLFERMTHSKNKNNVKLYEILGKYNSQYGFAYLYEPEIPGPINKESFRNMVIGLHGTSNMIAIKTQYYNSIGFQDAEPANDFIYFDDLSLDWELIFSSNKLPTFISFNNSVASNDKFRECLGKFLGR